MKMAESQITVGNVEVIGLSDAALDYRLTLDRIFPSVPAEAWEAYRQTYPATFGGRHVWHFNVGCYLVRSQGRTLLVDTGLGPAGGEIANSLQAPGGGCLFEELRSAGYRPEEVDVVLLTHLHRDHVGWNLRQEGSSCRLSFPRARYIVHQADWDTFHRPEVQEALSLTYLEQAITPLQRLGGLDLISGDLKITDEVTAMHTPGHTPGHMSVLIASGGRSAVITGDVVVHPAQVADADQSFVYDMDVEAARQTRHRLLERIEAEGMVMAGGHLPEPGFGRLVRAEGGRRWEALQDQREWSALV